MANITISDDRIRNFVEAYRKEYFEDHSMEWCLDQIIERGCAEIKRQVKTAAKRQEQVVAGQLMDEFNLTPAQAKAILLEALKQKKVAA